MEYTSSMKLVRLLKTQNLVTHKNLGITNKALRMKVMRLRQSGIEVFAYRGRGYSLNKQTLLTNKEMEVLKLLSDYTTWTPEDISVRIWGDYGSSTSVSGYISRLRQHGYKINTLRGEGYKLSETNKLKGLINNG